MQSRSENRKAYLALVLAGVIIIAPLIGVFVFFGWKGVLIFLLCIVVGTIVVLRVTRAIKRRSKMKQEAEQREWHEKWWRKWEQTQRIEKQNAIEEENKKMQLSGLGEMDMYKLCLEKVDVHTKGGPAWGLAAEYQLQEQLDWEAKNGIKRDNSTMSLADLKVRINSLMELGQERRIVALKRLGMSIPAKHAGYAQILSALRSELSKTRQFAEQHPGTWAVDSEVAGYITKALTALEARRSSGH